MGKYVEAYTKENLVREVHGNFPELSQAKVRDVVNQTLDSLTGAIESRREVRLVGLLSVSMRDVPERTYSFSGGKVTPAHSAPVIKLSKSLKDRAKVVK